MKTRLSIHSNTEKSNPMPGDVVRVARSSDKMIKNDTLGIIEGKIGQFQSQYWIRFEPEFPVMIEGDHVVASGGVRELIDSENIFNYAAGSHNKQSIQMLFSSSDRKGHGFLDTVKQMYVSV